MKTFACCIGASLLVACASDPSASSRPPPSAAGGKPRVLVVTHTAGFRHASIPVAEQTLAELATSSAAYEVDFARDAAAVTRMLDRASLAAYAAVFFVNTTGDLGLPDLSALLAWVAEGHAFLGAHSATDTYHDAPEYLAMIGAELAQHGAPCTVRATVEDASHPASAHLAPSFEITDEIYEWKADPHPGVHVLFALGAHPPDGHPEQNRPGDFPLAWTKTHGKGRVFYTALGHGEDTWRDERFKQHLLGAIRWSLAS